MLLLEVSLKPAPFPRQALPNSLGGVFLENKNCMIALPLTIALHVVLHFCLTVATICSTFASILYVVLHFCFTFASHVKVVHHFYLTVASMLYIVLHICFTLLHFWFAFVCRPSLLLHFCFTFGFPFSFASLGGSPHICFTFASHLSQ